MTIREYSSTDIDALIAIWDAADSVAHPFLPSAVKDKVRLDMRNIYLPNAQTWVLENNAAPIGFIAMIDAEIGGLFLTPAQHGKGFGRQMVDYVVNLKGPLTVEVFQDNQIGLRFYQRYGFVTTTTNVFAPSGHITLKMAMPVAD